MRNMDECAQGHRLKPGIAIRAHLKPTNLSASSYDVGVAEEWK